MMSSMADSLLPMPESPVIITPSPEMSSSTPWRVTQGASTRFRYSMVWLVNSTVVSSVRSSVRSCDPGALQALREAVQPPGDHQGRDVVKKQVVEALAPLLRRQAP